MGRDTFSCTFHTASTVCLDDEVQELITSHSSTDAYSGGWEGIHHFDPKTISDTIFGSKEEAESYIHKMNRDFCGDAIAARVVVGEKNEKLSDEKRKKIWSKYENIAKKFETVYENRKKALEEEKKNVKSNKIKELRKIKDAHDAKLKQADAKNKEALAEYERGIKVYEELKAKADANSTESDLLPKQVKPRMIKVSPPLVHCPKQTCGAGIPLNHVFRAGFSGRYDSTPDSIGNEKCPFCMTNLVGTDSAKIKNLENQVTKAKDALAKESKTPENVFFLVACMALS